jgi:hypothetical protein
MCSSSRHSWLEIGQGESFIIGFVDGVLFAAWRCIVEWSGVLVDIVSWSEVVAFLRYTGRFWSFFYMIDTPFRVYS